MVTIALRSLVLAAFAILPSSAILAQQAGQEPSPEVAALPALEGPAILTISGLDQSLFAEGRIALDIARLEALGPVEVETSSIWTKGVHRYTGVRLADLLAMLGVTDPDLLLEFQALNDYRVEIPVGEVTEEAPILAYLQDGLPMPVRDKGPVWMIYPFDSGAEYRTDTVYSRSIWQLDQIEVLR